MTAEKANLWLGIAQAVAQLSKDETKVGALLIGPGGETLLTGYNGPVRGEDDGNPEVWVEKSTHVKHAEANLFLTAARMGIPTLGCTLVVTKAPCYHCATDAVQAGIARVISPPPDRATRWTAQQQMAADALERLGVEVIHAL